MSGALGSTGFSSEAEGSSSETDVMGEFRAGVTATLRSWSALRTAVEAKWGGPESQAKAEDLRQNIYSIMDGTCYPPKIEVWDLEDNLAIYMEEEFSIVLEDDSEKQVADMLWRMYEACHRGDVSLARQAVDTALRAEAASAEYPVQVQASGSELDESDDDADDMDTNNETGATTASAGAQEYASSMLFGSPNKASVVPTGPLRQLGEAPPEQPKVDVDDDGFAPVHTKRRNRM